MSTSTVSSLGRQQAIYEGMPALIFWMGIFALLVAAEIFGGMVFLVMLLSGGLAVVVWDSPHEAPAAGILFLFAAGVLLPYSARLDMLAPSAWEMYYWAAGLLVITAAAVVRVGVGKVFTLPASAKVFFAVAMLAAVLALRQGVAVSYVVRQFYGIFLMVVYFALALHAGNEAQLIRRIATFGTLCALLFFVYFLKEFAEYGFHREMTTLGTQASLLATVLFIAGWEKGKRSYILGALHLLCVPALIFQRGAILTFLAALPVAAAIKSRTKKARVLFCVVFLVIALPGFVPGVADQVGEFAQSIPVLGSILPAGSGDSDTLLDRGLQLFAALDTVQAHPWLGSGLGSDIEWESPTLGVRDVPYVENGWAYLLQKMGLLGAAAFLWFLFTVLGSISRESLGLSACLLAVVLVTMFNEAAFFHFTTAPFVGTFAGLLLASKQQRRAHEVSCGPSLVPQLGRIG